MELKHRKNLIQFYIEIKLKTGANIAPYLEKLTKDRFKYWNFELMQNEIIQYYIDLGGTKKDAFNTLNELKNDI
jgi:hypothetical protein